MLLVDVNVLVYAFREESPDHTRYAAWLAGVVNGDAAFAMSDLVLGGFVRIVTHPKVFPTPTSVELALAFVEQVRTRPNCIQIVPGPRHWEIFAQLCRSADAKGNLVADAYLAAMAIESDCEWITTDRDYERFPGLRWRHPLK
jgi:toxin-antitoxin system PIN domain toxin